MNAHNEPQGRGDMIGAERYSVEELRAVIFEGQENAALSPALAVALLAKKDYPGKIEDFERVLDSEAQPRRVRRAAVTSLAQMRTEAAEAVLVQRVNIQDAAVRRTLAESLRSLGTERAIEALRQMQPPEEPDAPKGTPEPGVIPFPRGGLRELELRPPRSPLVTPAPQEAEPIRFQTLEPEAVQAVARRLEGPAAIALSSQTGYQLECFGRELTLLVNEAVEEDPAVTFLRERGEVFGVVAVHYTLESDTYSPKYYVLTRPAEGDGPLQIFITTLNGDVLYSGEATIEGERVQFRVQGLERPGSSPLLIEGEYADGALRIEQARSQRPTRSQRLSPRPR